jgi:hypothetical protein
LFIFGQAQTVVKVRPMGVARDSQRSANLVAVDLARANVREIVGICARSTMQLA